MKIVKSVKGSGSLTKDFTETIWTETKEQSGGFLGMLLHTLGASLLGNMLAVKENKTGGDGVPATSRKEQSYPSWQGNN